MRRYLLVALPFAVAIVGTMLTHAGTVEAQTVNWVSADPPPPVAVWRWLMTRPRGQRSSLAVPTVRITATPGSGAGGGSKCRHGPRHHRVVTPQWHSMGQATWCSSGVMPATEPFSPTHGLGTEPHGPNSSRPYPHLAALKREWSMTRRGVISSSLEAMAATMWLSAILGRGTADPRPGPNETQPPAPPRVQRR